VGRATGGREDRGARGASVTGRSKEQASKWRKVGRAVGEGSSSEWSEARCPDVTDVLALLNEVSSEFHRH
jgi:hypothetical protein